MIDRIQISVVIPARNRAKTLPACLDSVVRQTYPAAEVIVVDDGSTDETEQIVRKYPDPRIRYTQFKTSHGAQAARNRGVELAKSEWIAFQDSDDIWLPEKLAVQVETLGRHNFDKRVVIHGDGIRQDEQSGAEELIQVSSDHRGLLPSVAAPGRTDVSGATRFSLGHPRSRRVGQRLPLLSGMGYRDSPFTDLPIRACPAAAIHLEMACWGDDQQGFRTRFARI